MFGDASEGGNRQQESYAFLIYKKQTLPPFEGSGRQKIRTHKMKRKLLLSALLLAALPLRLLAQAYDFSAVAPSGQTLYYKIIDRNQRKVRITSPVSSSYTISGNLTIPEKVLSPNLTIYTQLHVL